ncbi:MAG: SHOCT domain-containing protein [Thaumarchaeota archaeon]|nr:SHOCT domain-containing protein [Nitrososphaerota archaeon]
MNSAVGLRSLRWVLVPVVLLAAVASVAVGATLYSNTASPQYYGWWPWAPFGWFFFIPLFFVAFFALRFFWWGMWGGWGWYHGSDSAMQVLRERFASGELTKEQFEQMRKDLAQS